MKERNPVRTATRWLFSDFGDFSCVAVSQLYSFSAPPTSYIFMVSDRQQPHFHLAAFTSHPLRCLTQTKEFVIEVLSIRPCWLDRV